MKHPYSLFALAAASCLFVSCAGKMDTESLIPVGTKASSRTGQTITAQVKGGSPDSTVLATISDERFKQALETSLVNSGLFRAPGSGGYEISAFITSINQPLAGISMTTSMEVNYTLRKGGAFIWSKDIKSSYTAPMGEAFVGAVRVRKSTEGASRENINLLIRALDEKL